MADLTVSAAVDTLMQASDAAAIRAAAGSQGKILLGLLSATESHANFNSTTVVLSTAGRVALTVGTWLIKTQCVVGDSDFATAGTRVFIEFSGTWNISGTTTMYGSQAADPPTFMTPFQYYGNDLDTTTSQPGQALYRADVAMVVVTVAGIVAIATAQNVANNSTHKLFRGSCIEATPIG